MTAYPQLSTLRDRLGDPHRDTKLNLSSVLSSETLGAELVWLISLAAAHYLRSPDLLECLTEELEAAGVPGEIVADAQSAASLMAMTTTFYRFRHFVAKPGYEERPPRLRMQGLGAPKRPKGEFELACLAIAALAGCEKCVVAHEQSVLLHGVGEEHVHEAVRLASVLSAAAVAAQRI